MKWRLWLAAAAVLVALALVRGAAGADGMAIDWYRIAGGGASSSGGGYVLSGTIGQHEPGTLTSGNYALVGGFWAGAQAKYDTFLPIAGR